MHRDVYTGVIILIVGFITINYILKEFIFEEKRLNEISENKFSSNITCCMVCHSKSAACVISIIINAPAVSK